MAGKDTVASPQAYARSAGLLYLVIIVTAIFGEFVVRGSFVIAGDATATAANIRSDPFLFRLGFASDLIAFISDVAVSLILYVLLRPISQPLALLAAFFRLAQSTILGINLLNHLSAALLLSGASYLNAFEPADLDALAMFFLQVHGYGYDTALVFFGMHCLVAGYLIARSGFLPWILGVLMVLAGAGYITDSFTSILVPEINALVAPYALVPAVLAEFALTFWLLVRGVNASRWRERDGLVVPAMA